MQEASRGNLSESRLHERSGGETRKAVHQHRLSLFTCLFRAIQLGTIWQTTTTTENLQGDDVRREGVRNSPDVFAQGVIFGARASHGAPGLLFVAPAALRREKDRGGAKQR